MFYSCDRGGEVNLGRTIISESLPGTRFGSLNVTILQQPSGNSIGRGSNRQKKVEHAFATSMVVVWREGPAASVYRLPVPLGAEARAGPRLGNAKARFLGTSATANPDPIGFNFGGLYEAR